MLWLNCSFCFLRILQKSQSALIFRNGGSTAYHVMYSWNEQQRQSMSNEEENVESANEEHIHVR